MQENGYGLSSTSDPLPVPMIESAIRCSKAEQLTADFFSREFSGKAF